MLIGCVNCRWKRKVASPALVIMSPYECPVCDAETEIKEG